MDCKDVTPVTYHGHITCDHMHAAKDSLRPPTEEKTASPATTVCPLETADAQLHAKTHTHTDTHMHVHTQTQFKSSGRALLATGGTE